MLKTISEKGTMKNSELLDLYNNLSDTKNISLLNDESDNLQPQDLIKQQSPRQGDPDYPKIDGLENFSFINLPDEELELKDQFSNFINQMRMNDMKLEK